MSVFRIVDCDGEMLENGGLRSRASWMISGPSGRTRSAGWIWAPWPSPGESSTTPRLGTTTRSSRPVSDQRPSHRSARRSTTESSLA